MQPKMQPSHLILILVVATFFTTPILSTPHLSHFLKHSKLHQNTSQQQQQQQQHFQVTQPLPTDTLTPSCTLSILQHNFTNTYGHPSVTLPYSPPLNCTWSHVTLEFSVSSKGDQYDRIAAVWLNGAELLRTSTAEPTDDGIFWKVHKGVTKYWSLLVQENLTLSVMLENIVNDVFPGVYQVNVTFLYYNINPVVPSSKSLENDNGIVIALNTGTGSDPSSDHDHRESLVYRAAGTNELTSSDVYTSDPMSLVHRTASTHELTSSELYTPAHVYSKSLVYRAVGTNELTSSELYERAADLIIPISGNGDEGFWYRIESRSDVHTEGVSIPRNTYKAVLEIYVSFHGNDEFWYKNPPDSYIVSNNLSTKGGNGAYREVLATIDGNLVGSVVPFPVIYTGGINPLFWEPVVGIGAFDLPSYDVDLTPFLGMLLDGKVHSFGLGVADGISFWLMDANLHLWLDPFAEEVQAGGVENGKLSFEIERSANYKGLDGTFEVEMERKREFSGWVNSSFGNLTTYIKHKLEFENKIKFSTNGNGETIKQEVEEKIEVRVVSDTGSKIYQSKVKREYPLTITTITLPGENGTYTMTTSVDNSYEEKITNAKGSSKLKNRQQASGWMLVKGNDLLAGEASTNHNYAYKNQSVCYSRVVAAKNGTLLNDTPSRCVSSHLFHLMMSFLV